MSDSAIFKSQIQIYKLNEETNEWNLLNPPRELTEKEREEIIGYFTCGFLDKSLKDHLEGQFLENEARFLFVCVREDVVYVEIECSKKDQEDICDIVLKDLFVEYTQQIPDENGEAIFFDYFSICK